MATAYAITAYAKAAHPAGVEGRQLYGTIFGTVVQVGCVSIFVKSSGL